MNQAEHAFYTDQARREAEARHVLRMPTIAARREYLSMVEAKRGKAGREYLEQEIMKQWKESKN